TAVRVPDAAGEEVERVADVASLARDDEVDGGATVAAPVAAPALFAVVAVEDAERRGPSGLRMLRVRAVPLRRTERADVGTEQVVGQVGQVDRGEQGLSVVHVTRPPPRRQGESLWPRVQRGVPRAG